MMDEGDGHGALTDGGGDTFHGGGADVTGGKDPGMTGFEKKGRTVREPCRRVPNSRSGFDESSFVGFDFFGQPVCVGHGTDEGEDRRGVYGPRFASAVVLNFHRFEMTATRHGGHFGVGENFDVACLLDAPGKIARHPFIDIVAANEQEDFPGALGKENGGLAGRICGADYNHFGTRAHLRFHGSGRIVDAQAFETRDSLDVQPTVGRAGSDEEALGSDGLAVIEPKDGIGVVELEAAHIARRGDLGAPNFWA